MRLSSVENSERRRAEPRSKRRVLGSLLAFSLAATACSVPGIGDDTAAESEEGNDSYLLSEGEESGASATSVAPPPTEPAIEVVPTLDERMTFLSAPIGAQYSAINMGETFLMPDDIPIFGGDVTGTFVAAVMDDQGIIRESRIVGTNDVINIETLAAFNETISGDAETSWAVEALNEDPAVLTTVLLAKDQSGALFVGRSFVEPLPQSASFQHEHIFVVSQMDLPTWISAMPLPPGGVMVSYREGIGQVVNRNQSGQNGYVEVEVHYPNDALPTIEQLYNGEALAAAGFQRSAPEFVVGTDLQIAQGPWTGALSVTPRPHLGVEGFVVKVALLRPAG